MLSPTAGVSACVERHATTSTAGRSALERRADTGGGASECASGSQLCTGAQPIFAARPARRSTNATESWSDAVSIEASELHESPPSPPSTWGAMSTIPSSANPSPSVVRTRYFQPASRAEARPLKPTRSAEAAVVASISSQAMPRFPASGTATSTAQKARKVP